MDNDIPCCSHSLSKTKKPPAISKSSSSKEPSSTSRHSCSKEPSCRYKSSSSKEPSASSNWSSNPPSSTLKSSSPSCSPSPSSLKESSSSSKWSSKPPSSSLKSSFASTCPDICQSHSVTNPTKDEVIADTLSRRITLAQIAEMSESERILLGENVVIKTYDPKTKKLVSQKQGFIPVSLVEENPDYMDKEYINPSSMSVYSKSSSSHTSKHLSKPASSTSKPLSKPATSTSKPIFKFTSHSSKRLSSKPSENIDVCKCESSTDSKKDEDIKDIILSGKTTFAQLAEKNERVLLGENVVIKTYDPKSKRLVSKRKGYIRTKPVKKFMENLDRVEAEHTDPSFPLVYDSYLKRTGQFKTQSMPMKLRMEKYWKTHDLVMDSDDIDYRMQISMAEFATFLIFVFILTFTLYLDVYPSQYKYHFTNSVRRAFITSDFKNLIKIQMNFNQIKSAGDIWGYLTKKLTETLHPTYYYNFDELRIKRLYFYDNNPLFENALIGTTRIRMKRVKNDSCLVHSAFRRLFKRLCYTYFSPSVEDKRPLGTDTVWYYNEGASNDTGTWGNYGHYTTGGYSQLLFWKSERDSRMMLYSMKNNHWLTRATRVLIVDFLLFNPTINFFCKVRMTFELPPEGGVNPLVSIDTVKLIFPIGTRDYIVLGLYFVIFWFGIYYIIEEVKRLSFFNCQYCLHLKRFLDLAICLLTTYIVIYILVKTFYLRNYITKTIRGPIRRRYISLDNIIRFEKIYMELAGLLLFLCFFKITCFLNFTNCMVVINVTIKRAMKQFIGHLLYLGLILSAFAAVAHLLFGTQSNYFRTWIASLFSLIRVILGDFNYLEFYQSDKILGPIFFSIFLFTVCFHLVFIFLAIVNETYSEAKSEQERLGFEHSLPFDKYLVRGLTKFIAWFRLGSPNSEECESKEAQDTLLRVKNALLKNNFTLTEINMFFAKYGIDYNRCVNPKDIQRIVHDLEKKGFCPTEAPTREDIMASNKWKTELEPEEILAAPKHQNLTLNFRDFKDLMKRMRNIEKKITQTSRRVAVIVKLTDYYNKNFWSVPIMGKKGENLAWYPGKRVKKLSILDKLENKFGNTSSSNSHKTN